MAQFAEIDIDQGADFKIDLEFRHDDGALMDLNGFSFSSSIKKSYYSLTETAVFTIIDQHAMYGAITLYLDASVTADIAPGRYVFDIKQTNPSGEIERIAEGVVTVNPQVTS